MARSKWLASPKGPIVGRAWELAEIEAFLAATPTGMEALRIEGEAGVGKTTLWLEALRAAREGGWRVLSASASEQESKLAFAVLGDLLGEAVDWTATQLSSPQRRAIEVALLRGRSSKVFDQTAEQWGWRSWRQFGTSLERPRSCSPWTAATRERIHEKPPTHTTLEAAPSAAPRLGGTRGTTRE